MSGCQGCYAVARMFWVDSRVVMQLPGWLVALSGF